MAARPKGAPDARLEDGIATVSYAKDAIGFLAAVLDRGGDDGTGALAWLIADELEHATEALNRERKESIETMLERERLRKELAKAAA
jgi:hypothetical protein